MIYKKGLYIFSYNSLNHVDSDILSDSSVAMNANAVPTRDDDGLTPRKIQPEFENQRKKIELIKRGKTVDKRNPEYRSLYGVRSNWDECTEEYDKRKRQEKKERRLAKAKAKWVRSRLSHSTRPRTKGKRYF